MMRSEGGAKATTALAAVGDRSRDTRFYRSPYFYAFSWVLIAFSLYSLQWSRLFQGILLGTVVVLSAWCFTFVWLTLAHRAPTAQGQGVRLSRYAVPIVTIYYGVAFAFNGGVPLFQILAGDRVYDIYGFGIDGLHVVMLGYTGYLGVRALATFLKSGSKGSLYSYVWILLLLASLGNRSAISFLLFASLVLIVRNRTIRPARALVALLLGISLLGIFGSFGNARLSFQIEQSTGSTGSSSAIRAISLPSESFIDTGLDDAWLWPYMYFASPLANLNSAINELHGNPCGDVCSVTGFVTYELLPDSVGGRLGEAFALQEFDKSGFLISPNLTASTTFGSAVGYMGFYGAAAMIGLLGAIGFSVVRLAHSSPVSDELMALLATLLFFSFFENMWAYTPLSVQLLYGVWRSKFGWRML